MHLLKVSLGIPTYLCAGCGVEDPKMTLMSSFLLHIMEIAVISEINLSADGNMQHCV